MAPINQMDNTNKNQLQQVLEILDKIVEFCELSNDKKSIFYTDFWQGTLMRMFADYKEVCGEEFDPEGISSEINSEEAEKIVKTLWEKFLSLEEGKVKILSYIDGFVANALEKIGPELTDEQLNILGRMIGELGDTQ